MILQTILILSILGLGNASSFLSHDQGFRKLQAVVNETAAIPAADNQTVIAPANNQTAIVANDTGVVPPVEGNQTAANASLPALTADEMFQQDQCFTPCSSIFVKGQVIAAAQNANATISQAQSQNLSIMVPEFTNSGLNFSDICWGSCSAKVARAVDACSIARSTYQAAVLAQQIACIFGGSACDAAKIATQVAQVAQFTACGSFGAEYDILAQNLTDIQAKYVALQSLDLTIPSNRTQNETDVLESYGTISLSNSACDAARTALQVAQAAAAIACIFPFDPACPGAQAAVSAAQIIIQQACGFAQVFAHNITVFDASTLNFTSVNDSLAKFQYSLQQAQTPLVGRPFTLATQRVAEAFLVSENWRHNGDFYFPGGKPTPYPHLHFSLSQSEGVRNTQNIFMVLTFYVQGVLQHVYMIRNGHYSTASMLAIVNNIAAGPVRDRLVEAKDRLVAKMNDLDLLDS